MAWNIAFAAIGLIALLASSSFPKNSITLLNASYEPTRELYQDFNAAFVKHWKQKTGQSVTIRQSYGASGHQSRAVKDGLIPADVVTLALAYDVDCIADAGLIDRGWRKRLPGNSAPFMSTFVLLVRNGNPKNIRDWNDLTRKGISIIAPDPKTSGGARWNYLAAWGYALHRGGSQEKAQDFVAAVFRNIVDLPCCARESTKRFVERGRGDVLIAWESEALVTVHETGKGKFEIVTPSVSILAEPSVSLVDKLAEKHGTSAVSRAYLEFLYSNEGQRIVAKHYFRPRMASIAADYKNVFPRITLFTIDLFGGWAAAQKRHFDDGGTFDAIRPR